MAREQTNLGAMWFVVLDVDRCRLLSCTMTTRGTPRVKERAALLNTAPKSKRGRPMALGGMTGHSYAEPHHHEAERTRRFARQVVAWLAKQAGKHAIGQLVVFAPAKLLGELRKEKMLPSICRIDTREGELTHLDSSQLAEQQLIRGLFASGC